MFFPCDKNKANMCLLFTVFVGKISQVAIYSGFSAEVIPKVWYTVCIYMQFAQNILITLPKLNIAPENKPSQKESNLPTTIFGRLC